MEDIGKYSFEVKEIVKSAFEITTDGYVLKSNGVIYSRYPDVVEADGVIDVSFCSEYIVSNPERLLRKKLMEFYGEWVWGNYVYELSERL